MWDSLAIRPGFRRDGAFFYEAALQVLPLIIILLPDYEKIVREFGTVCKSCCSQSVASVVYYL